MLQAIHTPSGHSVNDESVVSSYFCTRMHGAYFHASCHQCLLLLIIARSLVQDEQCHRIQKKTNSVNSEQLLFFFSLSRHITDHGRKRAEKKQPITRHGKWEREKRRSESIESLASTASLTSSCCLYSLDVLECMLSLHMYVALFPLNHLDTLIFFYVFTIIAIYFVLLMKKKTCSISIKYQMFVFSTIIVINLWVENKLCSIFSCRVFFFVSSYIR